MKKNNFSHYVNEIATGISRRFAQIAFIVLLSVNLYSCRESTPTIQITKIPPVGASGHAEGKVVWDKITFKNANQYAIIVMLHAIWDGGGGYYVKPYLDNYLNFIDLNGNFNIQITTGGMDSEVDEVIFYLVDRSKISDTDVTNSGTMVNKYLAIKTVYRSQFIEPEPNNLHKAKNGILLIGLIALLIIGVGVFIFNIMKKKEQEKREREEREKKGQLVKIEIEFKKINKLIYIPVKINGGPVSCVIDTGAEKCVISKAETYILNKNKQLSYEDFGEEGTVILASGDIFKGQTFIFKTVAIGTEEFNDIEAIYTKDPSAYPLLGQNVLKQFEKYTIDNVNNKVIFEIAKNTELLMHKEQVKNETHRSI